jgi:hypothetical protein
MGKDTYMLSGIGAWGGWSSGTASKGDLYRQATEFCQRQGKQMVTGPRPPLFRKALKLHFCTSKVGETDVIGDCGLLRRINRVGNENAPLVRAGRRGLVTRASEPEGSYQRNPGSMSNETTTRTPRTGPS